MRGFMRRWGSSCALALACLCAGLLPAAPRPLTSPDSGLEPASLTADTFDATLRALPPGRAVICEFYASWCPACQHFAARYERVAAFFHAVPPPQPEVFVARVDCAKEARPCSCAGAGPCWQPARGTLSVAPVRRPRSATASLLATTPCLNLAARATLMSERTSCSTTTARVRRRTSLSGPASSLPRALCSTGLPPGQRAGAELAAVPCSVTRQ